MCAKTQHYFAPRFAFVLTKGVVESKRKAAESLFRTNVVDSLRVELLE